MKQISLVVAALGLLASTPYVSAQKSDTRSPFAIEDCKSGCYLVKTYGSENVVVYLGAVPRTFRICSADGFGGTLTVDGKALEVKGTSFDIRSCRDVNALSIVLQRGNVEAGALP